MMGRILLRSISCVTRIKTELLKFIAVNIIKKPCSDNDEIKRMLSSRDVLFDKVLALLVTHVFLKLF